MIIEYLAAYKALIGKGITYSAAGHLAAKLGWDYWSYKRMSDIQGDVYQQLVERDIDIKPSAQKSYWESIGSLQSQHKYTSLEFNFTSGGISVYNWVPRGLESFMKQTLNGMYPAAQLIKVDDPLKPGIMPSGFATACTLELDRHPMFPLEMQLGETIKNDPLNAICAAGSNLPDGSAMHLQIIVIPIHRVWLSRFMNTYGTYVKTGAEPQHVPARYRQITGIFDHHAMVAEGLKNWIMQNAVPANLKEGNQFRMDTRGIPEKLASGVLFDTVIRVYSVAQSKQQAQTQLDTMVGAFMNVSDKNRFRVDKAAKPDRFYNDMMKRRTPMYATGTFLSPAELGFFGHFPGKNVPYVRRLKSRKLPIPEGIFTYDSLKDAWADEAIVFGYSTFQGKLKYVAFKDIRMLMQHLYVIGATGSGKSTFIIGLLLQVAEVAGFTFPDVKGTTIKAMLRYIKPEHKHRVNYIDFSSGVWFPSWNLMRMPGMNVYNLTTMIVNVFVSAFGENVIQYHSKNQLRNGLIAVIVADPDGTILDVYRMFEEAQYRGMILDRLAPYYTRGEFTNVIDFWRQYHEKPTQGVNDAKAIINKLRDIHDNLRPKYVTGQAANKMQWRRWMDAKAINLVNLDIGAEGNFPEIQAFFAKLISVYLRNATFSRSDIEGEHNRAPHIAMLDEFEEFEKSSDETERGLALFREYGVGMGLTHQSTYQINGKTISIIADNTFTQIALNVGDRSSRSLPDMFPGMNEHDFTNFSTLPRSKGGEGLEGVCRMKKLSPDCFTFYVLEYWDHFKDYGIAYRDEIIADSHQRLHAKGEDIEAYISARRLAARSSVADETEAIPNAQNGKKNKQVRTSQHRQPIGTLQKNNKPPAINRP